MGFRTGDTNNRNAGGVRVAWALASTLSLASWSCAPKAPGASLLGAAAGGAAGGSSAGGGSSVGGAGGSGGLVLSVSDGGKSFGGIASVESTAAGFAGVAGSGVNGACQPPALVGPGCLVALEDESAVSLCNGLDDDCDGSIDEGCQCDLGAVQACFRGPPARRGVGACADGAQICHREGELSARWGDCTGGILPTQEVCDGLDNDCNGCADDLDACVPNGTCPGPGDPRTPDGLPLAPYSLRGGDFFTGPARLWSWTVQGGPCDALTPNNPSFLLDGGDAQTATFTPKLSGDYTVTLTVTPEVGEPFTCTWIVHIQGPGLRIEMCYPESTVYDLDLYVKQPGRQTPWFTGEAQFSSALDQCCWANCEANLRPGDLMPAQTVTRANWGYGNSPLSLCQNDLQGPTWQSLGYCSSPRLDIDNNLVEATGVPENINVDAPKDNETFRIMVANFTGSDAHPLVNVYCDGRRTATIGAAPDTLANFSGTPGSQGIGPLWRVADVTTKVSGNLTTCSVKVLHPPGANTGFDVTVDDPRY